jgi:hypothetical protein
MKNFLLFKNNGEIEKKTKVCKIFLDPIEISPELKFTNYVKYENYIILHNSNLHKELNRPMFYFTSDRFNGDVALIKIVNDNLIKNLTIDDYFKKLTKTLQETSKNNLDSQSDSETDLSVYGKILTKEPFEYN